MKAISWVLVGVCAFMGMTLVACMGEKAYEELSTPQKTIQTYVRHARALRNSISMTDYLKVISCFSESDRAWYDEHFETLPKFVEPYYDALTDVKKRADVFGTTIAKAGPKNAGVTSEDISEFEAFLKVEGYDKQIKLVKEGPNWRIKGLFGVE